MSHETVYYSNPIAGFVDILVLVCNFRYSVTNLMGGHITMTCLSGNDHGKRKSYRKVTIIVIVIVNV